MGKLVLYGVNTSPPVRTVQLTLAALGLDYEMQEVNVFAGAHLSGDFRKKNPQHTVPVLEDDGQILWDSHAIAAYLVRKYAKNDSLYPKDFNQRAIVDQRLHFDSGVLFRSLRNITAPLFSKNHTHIPQEKIDDIYSAYDFMEQFLQQDFIAGSSMTIADFSMITTMTGLEFLVKLDPAKTPKLVAWTKRMAKLPYYQKVNAEGAAMIADIVLTRLGRK